MIKLSIGELIDIYASLTLILGFILPNLIYNYFNVIDIKMLNSYTIPNTEHSKLIELLKEKIVISNIIIKYSSIILLLMICHNYTIIGRITLIYKIMLFSIFCMIFLYN